MKGIPDVALHLWVVPPLDNNITLPKCRYINLELHSDTNLTPKDFHGCLLLENPCGANTLTLSLLNTEVKNILFCGNNFV